MCLGCLYLGPRSDNKSRYLPLPYRRSWDSTWVLYACFISADCTLIALLVPSLLNHLTRCLAIPGHTKAPRLRLEDENPPMVDIFITCAGEDDNTIYQTVKAACASDYQLDAFRVIVLDDSNSSNLSSRLRQLARSRRNLYYSSRWRSKDDGFKAGNLNHGLDLTNSLKDGPAEFIAALDADMIPDPAWLRALIPHLLRDPDMALAQPPQVSSFVP